MGAGLMRSIGALICLLLGVSVGPLSLLSFLPVGSTYQLQPILSFGAAAFGAGAVSIALVTIGAMWAHDSIEQVLKEELKAKPPGPSRTG